ncbi:MAG TPA: hypothetical protein VMU89_08880 [Thermomicrobiaceae bacterium]|nr:hypothetical protein [Thermomicrobiaceae bacterium]
MVTATAASNRHRGRVLVPPHGAAVVMTGSDAVPKAVLLVLVIFGNVSVFQKPISAGSPPTVFESASSR